jgi:DNA-binding response OmpR family regulator
MKILVAEDDTHIREGLVDVLESEGYEVVAAADGNEALRLYRAEQPALLCLDIMMPGMNGYDVCKAIRREDANIPILFISAKSEEIDRVLGLELGADDFIGKPFGIREVVARIRAVTRRSLATKQTAPEPSMFRMGDLEILPKELRARRGETVIDLGARDMSILTLLHEKAGQVVTRDELFERCWGLNHMPNSRTLDQHISQLRKRIERNPKRPTIIRTIQGIGYRYEG